jgi:hypothetical protein
MAMHARWLYGNLLYWDTHQNRIIDAWGPGVTKWHQGVHLPISAADTIAGFTTTLVEAGAGESTLTAATTVNGGGFLLTTDANEDDGVQIQMLGEAFQPLASTLLYMGGRVQISDATQSDLLVGLCITDTTAIVGMTDGIYFRKVDATTSMLAVLEKDSSETTGTAHTVVADTDVYLEIVVNGLVADFYVNGTPITTLAQTNIPDDELLTPTFALLAGEAVAKTALFKGWRAFRIAA